MPLVVISQRNAAHMNNHMPTIQALQEKFTQSRISGNPMEGLKLYFLFCHSGKLK